MPELRITRKLGLTALSAAWLTLLNAGPASAIIIYGGNGVDAPANDTAPAGYEDAFNRVGQTEDGTGVYLGNGFVLTVAHATIGGGLTVDGTFYSRSGGTTILENPNGTAADLTLYRVLVPEGTGLHGLDPLAIADTSLATNINNNQIEGIVIGTGVGQVEPQPVPLSGQGLGFTWADNNTRDKRWADAEIGTPTNIAAINGRTIQEAFNSTFNLFQGTDGAASQFDSGAPLIYLDNDVQTLAGIVHTATVINFTRSSDNTSFSDLAEYKDQLIVTIGDLDGDGDVSEPDLSLIVNNWGAGVTPGNWFSGDANGDGLVGIEDLDIILRNWSDGSPPASVSVPEPASAFILCGALCAFSRRPRRR